MIARKHKAVIRVERISLEGLRMLQEAGFLVIIIGRSKVYV